MEHEDLVGKKMYGFKFKSRLYYSVGMNRHIDKIGTIITKDHYDDYNNLVDTCRVEFENGEVWSYPYSEVLEHLVDDDTKTIDDLLTEMKKLTSELWKTKI